MKCKKQGCSGEMVVRYGTRYNRLTGGHEQYKYWECPKCHSTFGETGVPGKLKKKR